VTALFASMLFTPDALAQDPDIADYGVPDPAYTDYPEYNDVSGDEIHGAGTDPEELDRDVLEPSPFGMETPHDPIYIAEPPPRKPFKLPDVPIPESDYDEAVSPNEVFGADVGTPVRFPERDQASDVGTSAKDQPRTVTGLFSVRNKYRRTFDIDGKAGVYVASREDNLYRLDKQQVTITFDDHGKIVKITPEIPAE